jgi:hypothetical protein
MYFISNGTVPEKGEKKSSETKYTKIYSSIYDIYNIEIQCERFCICLDLP